MLHSCASFRFFTVFMLLERERERETDRQIGRSRENWLIAKTIFPPLDVTCDLAVSLCQLTGSTWLDSKEFLRDRCIH